MPPGQPTSFRLSAEAVQMLADLEESTGLKRSALLETLIRERYRKEFGKKKPGEPAPDSP